SHGYQATPGCAFRGHFFRPGQTDWAVSCLDDSTLHLFVFRAGGTAQVDEVVHERLNGATACLFSRANPEVVRYYHKHWSWELPRETPRIRAVNHDGIEQVVNPECCSVIHYWHEGRWLGIWGMD